MWQKINLLIVQDTAKVQEYCDSSAKDKPHIRKWVDSSAKSKCSKQLLKYNFNMNNIIRPSWVLSYLCDDIHVM